MNRGRGCMEIRETPNPFFMTTNDMVALAAAAKEAKQRDFLAPTVYRKAPPGDAVMPNMEWKFMFTRESDQIGVDIPLSDSKLSSTAAHHIPISEVARRKALGKHPVVYQPEQEAEIGIVEVGTRPKQKPLPQDRRVLDGMMQSYSHTPKEENPLLTTSNNEYGAKKPTGATYNFSRRPRLQAFSNGFNNMRYRDMGLNTSMTRSQVHSALDPQFA